MTIDEIKAHPWMQGEVATLQEVQEEISARKKEFSTKLNEDLVNSQDTNDSEEYREIFKDEVMRSLNLTPGSPADLERERKIKIYNPDQPRNTQFFSVFPP